MMENPIHLQDIKRRSRRARTPTRGYTIDSFHSTHHGKKRTYKHNQQQQQQYSLSLTESDNILSDSNESTTKWLHKQTNKESNIKQTVKKKLRIDPPQQIKATTKKIQNQNHSIRISSSDLSKISPNNPWIDLNVPPQELRPSATLTTGQCFHWIAVQHDSNSYQMSSTHNHDKSKEQTIITTPSQTTTTTTSAWGTHNATEWVGPFGPNHILSIRETPTTTLYRVLYSSSQTTSVPSGIEETIENQLRHYFQLHTPLLPLYQQWSQQDTRLARIAKVIPGVRVLQQDPLECLFSFICSSNNNIPRITLMLSRLRQTYGSFMMDIPTSTNTLSFYSFPTLESLKSATEDDLRQLGLGYRAKYIIQTRDLLLQRGGNHYLLNLRSKQQYTSEDVQTELIAFSGIGRKVADCIALFSLDREDAIPVDVHVWNIACRDYKFEQNWNVKTLTPTVYKAVGDLFRNIFTVNAGWAHSLLFVAELPSFRQVLPNDMVEEMDHVSVF